MKKFFLLIALLAPLTIMAHEGHGISGSKWIHLFVSHNYIAIGFALVIVGVVWYRRRSNSKN